MSNPSSPHNFIKISDRLTIYTLQLLQVSPVTECNLDIFNAQLFTATAFLLLSQQCPTTDVSELVGLLKDNIKSDQITNFIRM